ncbi:hypothetical protein CUC08_Gglean011620 [Alternaria sp. MG1]|nr:hypothetical protein CUC08_Gglean011620 [Alternaria sp. MG1]
MMFCCLQGVTRAAIELTFASGPRVAASKGIPVLANHQSLSCPSHFFHTFHHLFRLLSFKDLCSFLFSFSDRDVCCLKSFACSGSSCSCAIIGAMQHRTSSIYYVKCL